MNARELSFSVFRIGEDTWDFDERRGLVRHIFHKQEERVSHILLEHRAHRLRRKKLIEYPLHFVHDECFLLRPIEIVIKHIQSQRPPQIRRIKINNILHAVLGNGSQRAISKFPVRVYNRHASPLFYVVGYHIPHKRRFPGSRLPNDINMAAPVLVRNVDFFHLPPEHAFADQYSA